MTTLPVQQLYIHGQRVDATSGKTFKTINPATGEVIAEVQVASQADVERAVQSAAEGQKVWAAMTAMERSRILRRAVEILRERNDELAHLETLDTGKALAETTTVDIVTGADVVEYYAGLATAIEGIQLPLRDRASSTPAASRWAWSPASAPGTTRSRSPCGRPRPWPPATRWCSSRRSHPLTAIRLAEIYTEAGVPAGVFNVVQGPAARSGSG
jgi:betaine-aldehyde dehydrogenase